jgi:hypothetical protein
VRTEKAREQMGDGGYERAKQRKYGMKEQFKTNDTTFAQHAVHLEY